MARDLGGTDPPIEVRHGEVRAHRGVNPGTRLLFTATSRCRSTPDLFHAFPKNGAERRKNLFASRSAQFKDLLADATPRSPDITFEQEAQLDLGGVTARLLWFGGAHTKGDDLTFVEPDRALVSGDVVHNNVVPGIFRDGGTPSSWLAVLDKVAALNALHVLRDHSTPGDGSMVALEREFSAH